MKRVRQIEIEIEDEAEGLFCTLPYDMLDYVCGFNTRTNIFVTIPGHFETYQRCARLSGVNHSLARWLKKSIHYRTTEELLSLALAECEHNHEFKVRLCFLAEKSQRLKRSFINMLSVKESQPWSAFITRLKTHWRTDIDRTQEEGLNLRTALIVNKLFAKDAINLPSEAIELLFAYYGYCKHWHPRITIIEPTPFTMLQQLMIYDDATKEEETPENSKFFVTLDQELFPRAKDHPLFRETRLDMRLFKPFILVSFRKNDKPVYAFKGASGTFTYGSPERLANYIRASQRLRRALLECHTALKKPRIRIAKLCATR